MKQETKQKIKKKIIQNVFPNEDKRKLAKLLSGQSFDLFIMGIILANAVVMGLMTSEAVNFYFDRGLFLLDRLFLGIFIVEILLRIYVQGKEYFKSGWNVFDFVVVAVSAIPAGSAFIILRTFRLFLLLKYVHRFSRLNSIIQAFVSLVPVFASFLAVFLVVFYVFAIVAVNLFGDVFASFGSLGAAMFTLLQVFTLDGWASTIARPVMLLFPHAWIFFVSLVAVSFFIMVSFLAVVFKQVLGQEKA